VAFVVSYFAAALVQKLWDLPRPLELLVALLPGVAFLFFILAEVRLVRQLDELQRRIQLEAMAVGFPGALLLAMILGFLQRGGFLAGESDLRDLWGALVFPYFVGLWLARRRYS
jgi:hypothetical protein